MTSDSFEIEAGHSPMQRPQDGGMYPELQGIGSFTISDATGTHSPNQHSGRSPSHSPAISPRIPPQQLPDMGPPHNGFMMQAPNNGYGQPSPYMQAEAFPQLAQGGLDAQGMPAPPSINIDFAPPAMKSGFEQLKSVDVDSLTLRNEVCISLHGPRNAVTAALTQPNRPAEVTAPSVNGPVQQQWRARRPSHPVKLRRSIAERRRRQPRLFALSLPLGPRRRCELAG